MFERGSNRLQINFSLAAARNPVEQNWSRTFRRVERLRDFLQRDQLLRIQDKIRRCDELLVSMRIANNGFFAQLRKATLNERAKRLVVESCLAQKICRAHRRFQSRDHFQKFRLTRSAPPQFFDFIIVDLARGSHEQLLLPPDFRAPNHLGQQTAHHRFDWAAIVTAYPSREFQ